MKVLVCPLDWGLGHASRCVPLIKALRECGHHVMIGAAGGGQRLLSAEFPDLDVFDFPGYRVRYSRRPALFLPVMLMQMPALIRGFLGEQRALQRILAERAPDLVISDGRYGVFSRQVPAIFITHQIYIRVPGKFPGRVWVERLVLALNMKLIGRFREVWVPDYAGSHNLSGELSHGKAPIPNLIFIHPLARFVIPKNNSIQTFDVLAMVSGPEPQRGLFEAALHRELATVSGTRIMVRGLPEAAGQDNFHVEDIIPGQLHVFNHLPGEVLALLLTRAKLVISRSGYTTVMEMAGLGIKAAVLVPTPGQSEQEYLADHLDKAGTALRMDQDALDLTQASLRIKGYRGFSEANSAAGEGLFAPGMAADGRLAGFLRGHPLFQTKNPGQRLASAS